MREYLGMPLPEPAVGEEWEFEHHRDSWRMCVVLEIRSAREGWREYRIRFWNQLGRLEERWWSGEMRHNQSKSDGRL